MAKFFSNVSFDPRMQRQALQNKYNAARVNLLAVVVFTVINIVSLATGIGGYFLFSASVPYVITMFGLVLCGMMPDEFYQEMEMEGMFFLDESFFYITLAISVLILGLYVLCWFFSKKKPVWLTIALVLFIIDTVVMFLYYGIALDMILDIAFHAWVIWILVSGIRAHKDLQKMPKEDPIIEAEFTEVPNDESVEFGAQSSELDAPADASAEAPTEEKTENDDGFSSANGPLDI